MDDDIRRMNELIGSHGGVELVPNEQVQQPMPQMGNPQSIQEMNKRMAEAMRNVNTNSGGSATDRGAEILAQLGSGSLQTIQKEDGPMAQVIGEGAPIENIESQPTTVQGHKASKLHALNEQQNPQPELRNKLAAEPKINPPPEMHKGKWITPQNMPYAASPSPYAPLKGDMCSQCGMMHPPVKGKCPNAIERDESGRVIDTRKFLADMKNILESKIQEKKIKDHNKFFSYITIEAMKAIEKYEEGKDVKEDGKS